MTAIEEYVTALADRLRGPAAYTHRVLSEVEAHLQDSASALSAAGWAERDAECEAVARFGELGPVAAALNRDVPSGGAWVTIRGLIGAAALLAGVGMITVGVSAAAANALSRLTSVQQVFGPPPHAALAAASCAHWLAVQPTATSCTAAAALEARDDATLFLGTLGVLGVIVAILALVLRRRALPAAALSPLLVPTVAVTLFTGAALALAVLGVTDARVGNMWGQGRWFVEAACALAAAVIAGIPLLRSFRGAPVAARGPRQA